MKKFDVLIVEDDVDLSEALCETLEIKGYQVISAKNGHEALSQLSKSTIKLVVSDVQMPVMGGLELLQTMQKLHPEVPVLLMTAYGSISKAVDAIQSGAADYLAKPFKASELVEKVADLIPTEYVGSKERTIHDPSMKKLYGLASRVAKTEVTVLLQGESGTGKEVLAHYLHENSMNYQGPFIAINCAAIPENMLEAMLFGYEKGAFTGATQSVPGKFEQAQGGTLLLDEISEMDLALQAKLLRVIQEKEIERLGGQSKISLNVRILATTNRNLKEYVEQNRFREDLYYRLNVFPLKIPALRERKGDILPLAKSLMAKHSPKGNILPEFGPEAAEKLLAYLWPGNVRELENVMQRALIMQTGDTITATEIVFEDNFELTVPEHPINDLAIESTVESPPESLQLNEGLRSVEEQIILKTLQEQQGSRKITAEKLGISPRTLRYKIARMKEAGIAVAS
jgi:two-component system response regulator FlrC